MLAAGSAADNPESDPLSAEIPARAALGYRIMGNVSVSERF